MKLLYEKIRIYLNNEQISFREKMFCMLMGGGAVFSLLVMLLNMFTSMWMSAICCLILAVFCIALLFYANKTGKYQAVYDSLIGLVFMLFFPIMFFVSGGYFSGMPSVFNFAIMVTILLVDGKKAAICSMIEIAEYSTVCAIAYYHPEMVTFFQSESHVLVDIVFVSSVVSIASSLILFLNLREYTKQRKLLRDKNEQLERYDKAKSTFLTTVAHEIKNPLNSINLYARDTIELLEEETFDQEEIKENMGTIERNVMRIDRIVVDLMDTVAIEQGRLALSLVPMRLSTLLKDALIYYEKKDGLNGNKITLDVRQNLKPIKADHARLMQVVINLLNNACRYTKDGEIVVSLLQQDEYQVICVADNGAGMSEELKNKVLDGYVSADKEYWRHGIGLYVCHQIIKAHGGEIWIESELEKGTRVFFSLPMLME